MSHRHTVLISEPNAVNNTPYLPYLWAVLKSYHERHGGAPKEFEWLDPIYQHGDVDQLLAAYGDKPIDVLGLSCYTWNWQLQCRIAQHVKARHPHCLVVVGGPDPGYKDPRFFQRNPWIDLIIVNDGEIPFTRILDRFADNKKEFRDVPGLYFPDPETRKPVSTGRPETPTVFDHSPYIEQSALFERLTAIRGEGVFCAVLETNRGCPYSCSYCDWGSNTMSKVRRFDMERVKAEIEWLAQIKPFYIFLADANFGILPRDLEIADHLCGVKAKSGYPRWMYYSPAKNNPDRSLEIARKFRVSGLSGIHSLAIQHTNKDVLAATQRQNISPEKQRELARSLQVQNIPIAVQLILGIPGDTYDTWKGCFGDLMEWGIHEDYEVFNYNLLPNAPAAEHAFMERWEVETVDCLISTLMVPRTPGNDGLLKSRIVIKSQSFPFTDWVRMNVFAALARTLHSCCLTRAVAIYLRRTHGIGYKEFYEDLIDNFMTSGPLQRRIYDTLAQHFQEAAAMRCGLDELLAEQLPGLNRYLSASRWAYVQICLEFETFWTALREHLLNQYSGIRLLEDVVDYQKNIVLLPEYDRDLGKSFLIHQDWPGYFEQASREDGTPLEEPRSMPNTEVLVKDQLGGPRSDIPLDWNRRSGEDRWIGWIEKTVYYRAGFTKNNLHDLQLRARQQAPSLQQLAVL